MLSIESYVEAFFSSYSKKKHSESPTVAVLIHKYFCTVLPFLKKQNRLSANLRVCHVDHGLSEKAQAWQEFVKAANASSLTCH